MADTRITPTTLPDGAMVSLLSVLGDEGVTNSYTHQVWSVRGGPSVTRTEGRDETAKTTYVAFTLPDQVLHAPAREDIVDPAYEYPRANPDAALCHLMYVHLGGDFGRLPFELELDDLDRPRIKRISTAMGIADEMEAYLATVLDLNREQDVAPGLGI
ncbi:MAG TPA: hypothetical protein VGO06_16000 [Bosea sp. (in: a-proteobacteria)]|jgi:hypothetical protein|uniref:hypothetical protein n=1 Tax=Bosea sp. (in: a-proteobacteria) TaxID=1871050 RepID=UPI002E0EC8D1|nr:hypothetical protein [Bosea sp. (in: a-proteobacteria)]